MRSLARVFAALSIWICASAAPALAADPLCVMTYNIRVPVDKSPYTWPERRAGVVELIKKWKPDLLGTQEGVNVQLKSLSEDLTDYAWIGHGRKNATGDEYCAIFYRKDRIEPLEHGHYWLSDTPEVVGSVSWDHQLPRMVTWIRFRDRETKQEGFCLNTHFDHSSQVAREKSAELVLKRVRALNSNLPVILMGDFNSVAKRNPAYHALVGPGKFIDTWFATENRKGEGWNSFSSFRPLRKENARIDWILARGPVKVEKTELVTFQKDGRFPSDHCPIVAWVRLGAEAK